MPSDIAGTTILADRYEILSPLGTGTAATVYKVRDRRTGVLRAAKVLAPENAANPKVLARFEDEFRILRTLHHPHLAEVYDYGWTPEGGRFLVMELVDGVPLDEFFRANPGDIWPILYELCETLTFVHNHKLLHQDIKPSNILVKRTTAYGPDLPLVKLIDFGLMYRRDTGAQVELVGTPEYMAPEVARGDSNLTRAVDYYSLGATLFELLVGRPPFVGSAMEVMRAHLDREPVIEEEVLEWAELYPHVRGLLSKNWRARLEAFEEFRRAVVSRLTGGIEDLDRAYSKAKSESESVWQRHDIWKEIIAWLGEVETSKSLPLELRGRPGPMRDRLIESLCAECEVLGFHLARFGRTPSLVLPNPELGQVERFDRTIANLARSKAEAVVLVIESLERLPEDEAAFFRYLSTKRELGEGYDKPLMLIIARGPLASDGIEQYLPASRRSLTVPDHELASFYEHEDIASTVRQANAMLEEDSSGIRRLLFAYVALHPAPVPMSWMREFVNSDGVKLANEVEQLTTRHLVSKVLVAGVDGLMAASEARFVAAAIVPQRIQDEVHRHLVAHLEAEVQSGRADQRVTFELIAGHYDAIAEERSAMISRIRAAKAARKEATRAAIGVVQSILASIDSSGGRYANVARRYLARQLVKGLWARNHYTRAKQVIDEQIVTRGDDVPLSLLPKYIRGILDRDGPAVAMRFVEGLGATRLSLRLKDQILLEKALLLWHSARYDESQTLLSSLRQKGKLDTRDRHRITIYEAMNWTCTGGRDRVEDLLGPAAEQAYVDGCHDEFVLMSAIRAQEATIGGRPRESLRLIATTLRIAHSHQLYLRINLLYRLSAMAYQDLGLLRKAGNSQRKALTLASALGLTEVEATSWTRLAQYERVLGNFGNAIRFAERAGKVLEHSRHEADRAALYLTKLHLHVWMRSPDAKREIGRATWIGRTKEVNERGRYFMMLGMYCVDTGHWRRAQEYYNQASELLQQADFVDNLIMLKRARMQLAIRYGSLREGMLERRAIDEPRLQQSDSTSGQLERTVAKLEFAISRREQWKNIAELCNACLHQSTESTDATLRLEALSLVFRAYARNGRYGEAETAFGRLYELLRSVTGNTHERHIGGILDRLDFAQIAREYDLLTKRGKAGATTSLASGQVSTGISR